MANEVPPTALREAFQWLYCVALPCTCTKSASSPDSYHESGCERYKRYRLTPVIQATEEELEQLRTRLEAAERIIDMCVVHESSWAELELASLDIADDSFSKPEAPARCAQTKFKVKELVHWDNVTCSVIEVIHLSDGDQVQRYTIADANDTRYVVTEDALTKYIDASYEPTSPDELIEKAVQELDIAFLFARSGEPLRGENKTCNRRFVGAIRALWLADIAASRGEKE